MTEYERGLVPAYERRLVLFIDFLGFREVVASTERDAKQLPRLLSALDAIKQIGDADASGSQRVTQFSDSVVMSYRVDEQSAVFWMVNAIALTIISLAERGFLLRGAVTVGDLYHTDRHVVGPAMVRAYEMESREARYPRVIIDPIVLKFARRYRQEHHTPDEEEDYVRGFLAKDADDRWFIDYISWQSVVAVAGADDDGYPDYLATLSGLLRAGLTHEDVRVTKKYLWLHPRYLAVLDMFKDMPANSPYRAESPENCEAIESLPRLESQARACRARLDSLAPVRASD